nr:hypothetical protein [Elizabethkingia bruuniana]
MMRIFLRKNCIICSTLNIPDKKDDGLIEAFGGLLIPEAQGEDYEEQDFANKMKKKRKRKRGLQ